MNNSQFNLPARAEATYLKLVRTFPLAALRSDEHLHAAQHVLDELSAKRELDAGESLYLDALCDLVTAYEDEHHPIGPASDADMLAHLLEAKGVSQTELHRATGIPKSTISEVLAGKRPFSRTMLRKLAAYFKVDVTVLAGNL